MREIVKLSAKDKSDILREIERARQDIIRFIAYTSVVIVLTITVSATVLLFWR